MTDYKKVIAHGLQSVEQLRAVYGDVALPNSDIRIELHASTADTDDVTNTERTHHD